MASPQLENGFTRIANEIMDKLARYRIPGEQRQCLDVILRKTYGFNKKFDHISNSQFCEATGLKKTAVCRAINQLVDKNLVIKKDNKRIPSYEFNKNYTGWKKLSKKITVIKKDNSVIKKDNKVLSKKIPTKERKETIQKTYNEPFLSFWEKYPKKRAKGDAYKAWKKLKISNGLFEEILNGLDNALVSKDWNKENGQFIPYPATWLNGRRWEDEYEQTTNKFDI